MNRRGFLQGILAAGWAPALALIPPAPKSAVVETRHYVIRRPGYRRLDDAQRLENYWRAAMVEQVALAPKPPFIWYPA